MSARARACPLSLVLSALLASAAAAAGPPFYPDDPRRADDALVDVAKKPKSNRPSLIWDRLLHTFSDQGQRGGEAENVNTLDEVPDGPWFHNRHGQRRMSVEELTRGPDQGTGPTGSWTVTGGKSIGVSAGFNIVDGSGDRYLIKLDPADWPELNSSAEVIVTKVLHAAGYHVPENHLVRFDPAQLAIDPKARMTDEAGGKVKMTPRRLRRLIAGAARMPDGRVRALASKILAGESLGPFLYFGTRPDDPNDVVLHERRRELRGLRAFAAWLNHDDSRAENSLDLWIEQDGRHIVRHHLIDFGSALGAGYYDLLVAHSGSEYWLRPGKLLPRALGLGLVVPRYRKVPWPRFDDFPEVGRYQSIAYDPVGWVGDYPNPAFVEMTERDALWASAIIARFTGEELLAIVRTGELSNKAAEEYLWRSIVERQRRTLEVFLGRLAPLVDFAVAGRDLTFVNLGEEAAIAAPGSSYEARWFLVDDQTGARNPLEWGGNAAAPRLALPPSASGLLAAEIDTTHPKFPQWKRAVTVYLRPSPSGYEVVGIEREAGGRIGRK